MDMRLRLRVTGNGSRVKEKGEQGPSSPSQSPSPSLSNPWLPPWRSGKTRTQLYGHKEEVCGYVPTEVYVGRWVSR